MCSSNGCTVLLFAREVLRKGPSHRARKEAVDSTGASVAENIRFEMFPRGCSRCRNAPGCAPICWLKRTALPKCE